MKFLFIVLFFGLAVSNCGQKSVTQTQSTELNIDGNAINLSYGESATHNGVTLKFTEVVEESRCPTYVDCIWAGRAIIKIEVTTNGKTETKTLIFGATRSGETATMDLYSGAGITYTAASLTPYPSQSGGIAKNDYVVNISVENK